MSILSSDMRRCRGFTLIELSIVVLILSLMMGGIFSALSQQTRIANKAELEMKMSAIYAAITSYIRRSGVYSLPCPADPALAVTSTSFGVALATGCASATYKDSDSAAGAVPVRTIGLPDDYAFDPWGNQFTYAVSRDATATSPTAFTTYAVNDTTLGVITIKDLTDTSITATAVMVLLSHGPDGFGSFTFAGTRKSGYSTNSYQQSNCNCTSAAVADTYDSIFYSGANTLSSADSEAGYDDITRYFERSNFALPVDIGYK